MDVKQINVNGQVHRVEVEGDTPLLWVIRDMLGLTGTKFGCGIAQCGACSVLLDGQVIRSCSLPISSIQAKNQITTIEGMDFQSALHQAWEKWQVVQCGYCQSGQIIAASALLKQIPSPSDEDIDTAMSNICRCGTYTRIRAAIKEAAKKMEVGV